MAYSLGQAYPNPFNPQTTISFYNDQSQHVRIEVYDIRGRRITELTDQQYQVGEHSVEWRGRDSAGRAVPSGEYFFRVEFRVEIGGQVETLKAMLLR
jgi:flagellar hook assembly protein FlgD